MRISYLASAALAVCFLPLGTTAYASCSSPTCGSSESITYGSGSYNSGASTMYNSGSHGSHASHGSHDSHAMSTRYSSGSTAACPAGSTRSQGVCMASGGYSSAGVSASTGSSYTSSTSYSSGTTSSGMTYSANNNVNVQPFTTSVSNISNYRIAGMGSNEFLSETNCPTSVYNPGGAKVLGCYSVVKPIAAPRPAPIVVPQVSYQQVRVVRPIIYVRYPVPTPYAVPVYQQQYHQGGCGTAYSRYGNNWPRLGGGCGGW